MTTRIRSTMNSNGYLTVHHEQLDEHGNVVLTETISDGEIPAPFELECEMALDFSGDIHDNR